MAEDLRTVLSLVTGVRVGARRCRRLAGEVLEGGATPIHEAAVYLLATHFLALADRPAFDGLAWAWLSARGLAGRRGPLPPRTAGDALRLGVFAVESAWPAHRLDRLVALVAWSRSTPVWVGLSDLARSGGRHAARLVDLVERADLTRADDPLRRAAFLALSAVHELHHMEVRAGEGWAVVANRAPDLRAATVFTAGFELPTPAREALEAMVDAHGLLSIVHSHAGGVHLMAGRPDARAVVPLHGPRTYPDDHLSAVRHVHGRSPAANHPGLPGLHGAVVRDVFRTGPAVAREGRWWVVRRVPVGTGS